MKQSMENIFMGIGCTLFLLIVAANIYLENRPHQTKFKVGDCIANRNAESWNENYKQAVLNVGKRRYQLRSIGENSLVFDELIVDVDKNSDKAECYGRE